MAGFRCLDTLYCFTALSDRGNLTDGKELAKTILGRKFRVGGEIIVKYLKFYELHKSCGKAICIFTKTYHYHIPTGFIVDF